MPRRVIRPKVVATAVKLAEDLDLICENEDTDKAVAQFFKSVPKVLVNSLVSTKKVDD